VVKRVGVTGHRGLDEMTTAWITDAICRELESTAGDLVGMTCLADGADQIFASVVLAVGASLEVVVPAREYRQGLPQDSHGSYDRFLAAAKAVHHLDHQQSDPVAHMEASTFLVDHIDVMIAVWDGLPSRGWGGTADVIDLARQRGKPVTVLWPPGATRA
jgi:hypothetical protein